LSRQSFSPELPSKPIRDFHVFSIRITRDVTSDLSPRHDRPVCVVWRIQNFLPMRVENYLVLSVFTDECCHPNRLRVELMLIEGFEIRSLDFPQRDTLKSTHCSPNTRITGAASDARCVNRNSMRRPVHAPVSCHGTATLVRQQSTPRELFRRGPRLPGLEQIYLRNNTRARTLYQDLQNAA
jgi:hypothetical protein